MTFITPEDLAPFADIDENTAGEMIADAEALAIREAPCLADAVALDSGTLRAVKALLRGALLRWHEAGAGGVSQQTAGPFSVSTDTRQRRWGMFLKSEISQLKRLCQDAAQARTRTVDMSSDGWAPGAAGYWSTPTDWVPL